VTQFLGVLVSGGADPELARRLVAVEADLRPRFEARADASATIAAWAGVRDIKGDQGPGHGLHSGGRAMDVNYVTQPYIATRHRHGSTDVVGGEDSTGILVTERTRAVEVCDRALQFFRDDMSARADLSRRGPGEATADIYDRFAAANAALKIYLGLAFQGHPALIARAPADADPATDGGKQTLERIPIVYHPSLRLLYPSLPPLGTARPPLGTLAPLGRFGAVPRRPAVGDEFNTETEAMIRRIDLQIELLRQREAAMALWAAAQEDRSPDDMRPWQLGERFAKDDALPGIRSALATKTRWTITDPELLYYTVLRDYERVRVPMVFGHPSARPGATRNPAAGFLDLRKEMVVAMCDVARLRWGACDFGDTSGDIMHFDLGH
jgi:hypothetical protein